MSTALKAAAEPAAEVAISWGDAEVGMRLSEERFEKGDVDGLVAKYDEDVVIRFAALPEIRGKEAAKAWLRKRLKRQQGYKLKKELLAIDGQKVTRSWTGNWTDSETQKPMEGRGIEFLEYRGGKLILWDACFHVWEKGRQLEGEYFDPA